MEGYKDYWAATIIRGVVAVIAATAIVFTSAMASTVILAPAAFVLTVLCLAAYFTFDGALVLVSSFMIPSGRPGRVALGLQGVACAGIGVFLFSLVYDHADLHLFLYLAAVQAACAAIAEFVVARGTAEHHNAVWCYASSAIAGVSAVALVLGRDMRPRQQSLLIYGYLGLQGFNLIALAARMLFAERQSSLEPKSRLHEELPASIQ